MTDRSVPTTRRRPKARPDEIIEAALELFAAKGFDATRMEDVARAARVSKGGIYLYFPDKTELLKAIIKRKARGELVEMALSVLDDSSAEVSLRRFFALLANVIETTRLPILLKIVIAEGAAHPDIARFYLEAVISHMMPKLEALLLRGMEAGEFRRLDAKLTVRCIVAPMMLTAIWKAVFEPVGAPKVDAFALGEHAADLILKGLKP